MTRVQTELDRKISEAAAEWLIRLEDNQPIAPSAFADWLVASPRHVEEFMLVSAIWRDIPDASAPGRDSLQKLLTSAVNDARDISRSIVRLDGHAPMSAPRASRWRIPVATAAAALLAACLLWVSLAGRPQVYSTALGEQRSFKLEDGSIVYLNTQSQVETRYTEQTRTVRLLSGEALFIVEKDAQRPFRVEAGGTEILAVGTQFNVYRRADRTTISVVEGVVQVSPTQSRASGAAGSGATPVAAGAGARLAAGEQAQVSVAGAIVRKPAASLESVMAWRERRLVFRGEPLADVAQQFNRYNRLQIYVQGAAAQSRLLTGVFDADDPASLVLFLQADQDLVVESDGQAVTIRPR